MEIETQSWNFSFSAREQELCRNLMTGMETPELALVMNVEQSTIKTMMNRLHLKTGLKGHNRLLIWIVRHPSFYELNSQGNTAPGSAA